MRPSVKGGGAWFKAGGGGDAPARDDLRNANGLPRGVTYLAVVEVAHIRVVEVGYLRLARHASNAAAGCQV